MALENAAQGAGAVIGSAWNSILGVQWASIGATFVMALIGIVGFILLIYVFGTHNIRASVVLQRNGAEVMKDYRCKKVRKSDGRIYLKTPFSGKLRLIPSENIIKPRSSRSPLKWEVRMWQDSAGDWHPAPFKDPKEGYVVLPQDLQAEFARNIEVAASRKFRNSLRMVQAQPFISGALILVMLIFMLIGFNKLTDLGKLLADSANRHTSVLDSYNEKTARLTESADRLAYVLANVEVTRNVPPPSNITNRG